MIRASRTLLNHSRKMAANTERLCSSFFVRCIPGEEKLQIRFDYRPEGVALLRTFNSERTQTEPVGRTLERLSFNVNKFVNRKSKNKKRKKDAEADLTSDNSVLMKVFRKGEPVPDDVPLNAALTQGTNIDIAGTKLVVEVNPPTVNTIGLPVSIMSGFPIFPQIDIEFADLEQSEFSWSKVKYAENPSGQQQPIVTETVKVSDSVSYTPENCDIGYKLKLTCVPKSGKRTGVEFEVETKGEVTAGPGLCPFENRQLYTKAITEDGVFRVVSYNILADLYADSEYTRTELFPYCPPYALAIDYRKYLILKELKGYNSDILCLQEVDSKVYKSDLMAAMDTLGFAGSFKSKGGVVAEGSAIFHRRSKFKEVCQHDAIISDILESDPICADILEKVYSKPDLKGILETRSSALHVMALESKESCGKLVLVASTHLYFHPKASNIRLIHSIVCIRYLEKLVASYTEQGYSTSLVFCGDFNSTPNRDVYKFMTTKSVTADMEDWLTGGPEQFVEGMNFSHSLNLQSGCGLVPYTNYTEGFNGMLDYIYYDLDTLEVSQAVPPPQHEEVTQHSALPSVVFPSDHIAQICDFKWKF